MGGPARGTGPPREAGSLADNATKALELVDELLSQGNVAPERAAELTAEPVPGWF